MTTELKFKSTKDIKVPTKLIDQLIGQEHAADIVRKAARQRRHILLIGDPGTGKSLLGLGLAELLPKENLVDILSFANPNDENQPLVRVLPSGQGRDMVARSKMEAGSMFKHQNIFMFALLIIALIAPWWAFNHYSNVGGPLLGGLMFMAFFIGGIVFLASFIFFLNLSKRVEAKGKSPKIIVDAFNKKQAPFLDATGAHAGALLGDVLHDPFQSFQSKQKVAKLVDGLFSNVEINNEVDALLANSKDKIQAKESGNYQAIHLPRNSLFVMGEANRVVQPVEVLSSNRYDYDGPMIKLSIERKKELIVTPEHKIAVWNANKIEYIAAKNIKKNDSLVTSDKVEAIFRQEQLSLHKQYHNIINQGLGAQAAMNKLGLTPKALYNLLNKFGNKAQA